MADIRSLWALGLTVDCHAEVESGVKRERKALPLARDPAVDLASLPRLHLHLVILFFFSFFLLLTPLLIYRFFLIY